MLIEEAVGTQEANITSALFLSLEQMVLVGVHMRLTPYTDLNELAKDAAEISARLEAPTTPSALLLFDILTSQPPLTTTHLHLHTTASLLFHEC